MSEKGLEGGLSAQEVKNLRVLVDSQVTIKWDGWKEYYIRRTTSKNQSTAYNKVDKKLENDLVPESLILTD